LPGAVIGEYGHTYHNPEREFGKSRFYRRMGAKYIVGLAVIFGCAHRGMINTIRHLQHVTGEERIYCVIGGTHLFNATQERLDLTVADLRETGIQRLGVSHCTGFNASCRLAKEFQDMFFLNNAGVILTLP
jgi:7,8-dihydropterin-6-yl-methyl-4-(beta-D-ribofuranosyl)aminobenzene 5'-phosphate synthase